MAAEATAKFLEFNAHRSFAIDATPTDYLLKLSYSMNFYKTSLSASI